MMQGTRGLVGSQTQLGEAPGNLSFSWSWRCSEQGFGWESWLSAPPHPWHCPPSDPV